MLASYAQHSLGKLFYQRIFEISQFEYPKVSEEQSFKRSETARGITYQNLHRVNSENGRIYNFFRGNNFNPHFVFSDDDAKSWSDAIQLIKIGDGNDRPYIKYASNGKDRIDLFYTDGHPRNVKQNNVYHIFYKDGAFRKSDGSVVRTLDALKTNPMTPEEGTLVFSGATDKGRGWVWDLEYDQNSQPYGAFISSPSGQMGTDMRYWTASYKNGKWSTEEIAFAGSNLYPKEEHYAGGIALNPSNSNEVVISADVNPKTGEALPKRFYQLFKGTRGENGWNWTQLTHDPLNSHLRPTIVRGKNNALFWFAGEYKRYQEYDCEVLMSEKF